MYLKVAVCYLLQCRHFADRICKRLLYQPQPTAKGMQIVCDCSCSCFFATYKRHEKSNRRDERANEILPSICQQRTMCFCRLEKRVKILNTRTQVLLLLQTELVNWTSNLPDTQIQLVRAVRDRAITWERGLIKSIFVGYALCVHKPDKHLKSYEPVWGRDVTWQSFRIVWHAG